jgi:hypothetical protein
MMFNKFTDINKKKLIIFGGTFLVVLLILVLWQISKKNNIPTPTPISTPTQYPTLAFIPLPTILNVQGDKVLEQNQNYTIIYSPKFQQYNISITGFPFDDYRKPAEQDFLKVTGFDEKTACKKSVVVTTPYFANPAQSGRDYNLSFCE